MSEARSLDAWSILILIGIAQGLFVISLFLFKGELRKTAPRLLFVLLLMFLWLQAEFLSVRWPLDVGISRFYGTRFGSWFLIGPLFYLYTRTINKGGVTLDWKDTLHFLPFLVFVIVLPSFLPDFLSFRQVHYGMLTAFDSFNQVVTPIQYLYSGVFVAQFIHLLTYLALSTRLISRYKNKLYQSYSTLNQGDLLWLRILNYSLIAVFGFATIFLSLFFFTQVYRRHLDYIYVLPMGFLMYLIGYKLAGVRWQIPDKETAITTVKYGKSSLKSAQAQMYTNRLEQYMLKEKPFLKNELRLQDLSDALEIPTHHLSQIINEQMNQNFFDYINAHRIEESKRLIVEKAGSSLLEIAFESGFNNKTSFTNAFKRFEEMTPSAYRSRVTLKVVSSK